MEQLSSADSVLKDFRTVSPDKLSKIKISVAELENFPNNSQVKKLNNQPVTNFSLGSGNYLILDDLDWTKKEIYILKMDTAATFISLALYPAYKMRPKTPIHFENS